MLFRKKYILAKIESTYGADSSPVGSNAILTKNLSITPYAGNTVGRDLDREALGNDELINTGANVQCSFEVELAGSGAAGTAPAYGVLLRACGLSETVTALVDTVYQPVSSAFESASLHYIIDGQLHKILGARGSVSFSLNREQIPIMSFNFTGLYAKPVAAGAITPDWSNFQTPLPVTKANTPTFTIGAYAANAEAFSFDLANNVVYRNVVNNEGVIITDRAPAGNFTVEAPALATKDFFTAVESHNGVTTQAIQVIHGTVAGNICQFDGATVQLSGLSMQDSDGLLTYSMDARYIPTDAGDDEWTLTIK